MAHFAKLDENNIVIDIIKVNNEDILDSNDQESEQIGIQFLHNLFGADIRWVQTSYHGHFRKRYAGIGYYYNQSLDAFISPKPYESWILNYDTLSYEPPIPIPNDGYEYEWDEENQVWKQI